MYAAAGADALALASDMLAQYDIPKLSGCAFWGMQFSPPVFEPVDRENPDKTCVPHQPQTFERIMERLARVADLKADSSGKTIGEVDAEPSPDVDADDDAASASGSVKSTAAAIPKLHAANMALYSAKEELRQACDVMALLSGVASGVPQDARLFQVRFRSYDA